LLVSVPKKHFKRAVKRNRVKRQVREAYRLQRQIVSLKVKDKQSVVMAFIWLDDKLWPTETVKQKVGNLMQRISEKL
jgi:ribonuclease P protein component